MDIIEISKLIIERNIFSQFGFIFKKPCIVVCDISQPCFKTIYSLRSFFLSPAIATTFQTLQKVLKFKKMKYQDREYINDPSL